MWNNFFFICTAIVVISCAPSKPTYSLENISDKVPQEKKQVFLYVELTKSDSNRVSVWNWCKHETFDLERDNGEGFVQFGEFKTDISQKPGPCLILIMEDKKEASFKSRYRAYPVSNGQRLDKIPVQYSTEDSSVYNAIKQTAP